MKQVRDCSCCKAGIGRMLQGNQLHWHSQLLHWRIQCLKYPAAPLAYPATPLAYPAPAYGEIAPAKGEPARPAVATDACRPVVSNVPAYAAKC